MGGARWPEGRALAVAPSHPSSHACFSLAFAPQSPGCDGVLGSNQTLDSCGVCGGDHSTCKLVVGNFSDSNVPIGYHKILEIPQGATRINVTEMTRSPNYLGKGWDRLGGMGWDWEDGSLLGPSSSHQGTLHLHWDLCKLACTHV